MNTLHDHDEKLRHLFRQLPEEKPSAGFSSHVMAQVRLETQRITERKRKHRMAWIVSIPLSIIFLTAAGYFSRAYWEINLLKYFEPLYTPLSNAFSSIIGLFTGGNGDKIVLLGVTALVLLLGDLFFRRYMEQKKQLKHTV